jgi:hypothetical protein
MPAAAYRVTLHSRVAGAAVQRANAVSKGGVNKDAFFRKRVPSKMAPRHGDVNERSSSTWLSREEAASVACHVTAQTRAPYRVVSVVPAARAGGVV